jgi:hypothetical protein
MHIKAIWLIELGVLKALVIGFRATLVLIVVNTEVSCFCQQFMTKHSTLGLVLAVLSFHAA